MTEPQIRADERARCVRVARLVAEKCALSDHVGALLVERALREEAAQ